MFHLLLGDLAQQSRENSMLAKSAMSLTLEKMKVWEKLNAIEVADKKVSK